MLTRFAAALTAIAAATLCTSALAADASDPIGEPRLELPTLHSLGVYWVIHGDDNHNAKITFQYRKEGATVWRNAPNLFRVEKGANKYRMDYAKGKASVDVPDDAWLFAGSALLLEPATPYELKLTLTDSDGGSIERTLKQSTRKEPLEPPGMKIMHVIPAAAGATGGTGTEDDPFKGLESALAAAQPGMIMLLHKGTYDGPITIEKSGEPDKPIIWRGAGDGDAIIDGHIPCFDAKGAVITVDNQHDVWFEKLTIVNANSGIRAFAGQRIVMRRCNVHDVNMAFFATAGDAKAYFISDNIIKGPLPFPMPPELWHRVNTVGIRCAGEGHDICYNRVSNMEDTASTEWFPARAIDVHHNEGFDLPDDGAELDGSDRNSRNFLNRYTNSLTGISFQPVYGGPCYAFKNVHYNFRSEATKLHNGASGAVIVHNTFVHTGTAWLINGSAPVSNCYTRNNLFIGTESSDRDLLIGKFDGMVISLRPRMENCDFDFDGFSGFKGDKFMHFNGVYYATPEEAKAKSGIEKHLVMLDPNSLFLRAKLPTRNPVHDPRSDNVDRPYGTLELNRYDPKDVDLRLKPACAAVGVGEVLEGFGDEPGSVPYLGAFAPGSELPWYGPRSEKK